MVAGFFVLGVVINLGPRIGRFAADGTPLNIQGHNLPVSLIGLMLIIVGFFGFLGGCIIYAGGAQWTTIYGTPVTLSAISFNTLMGVSGGIIGAYIATRNRFWMMSGALAGIIAAASGLDVYYPPLAFLLGFVSGMVVPRVDAFITRRFKLDDAVGAFSVHGVGGFIGVAGLGVFSAFPNMAGPDVSFTGQLISALVMAALGFIPGFGLSWMLTRMGILRVSPKAEIAGLDLVEIPLTAYPEGVPAASVEPRRTAESAHCTSTGSYCMNASPIDSWEGAEAYFTFADRPVVIGLILLAAVVVTVWAIVATI